MPEVDLIRDVPQNMLQSVLQLAKKRSGYKKAAVFSQDDNQGYTIEIELEDSRDRRGSTHQIAGQKITRKR